jgi:hypothetical protein
MIPMPERPKRIVFYCILGSECACGDVDHFCVNARRREVDAEEDDNEKAAQEKEAFMLAMQTPQDARGEPLESQRT